MIRTFRRIASTWTLVGVVLPALVVLTSSSLAAENASAKGASAKDAPPPKLAPLAFVPDKGFLVGKDFKLLPAPGLRALSLEEARDEREREAISRGGLVLVADQPGGRAADDKRRIMLLRYPGGLPLSPDEDTCREFWSQDPGIQLVEASAFPLPGVPGCRATIKHLARGSTADTYLFGGGRRGWQLQCDDVEAFGVRASCEVMARSFVTLGVGRLRGADFEVPIPMSYRPEDPPEHMAWLKKDGGVLLASVAMGRERVGTIRVIRGSSSARAPFGTPEGCATLVNGLLDELYNTMRSDEVQPVSFPGGEGCRGVYRSAQAPGWGVVTLLRQKPRGEEKTRLHVIDCYFLPGDPRGPEACSEVLEGFRPLSPTEP